MKKVKVCLVTSVHKAFDVRVFHKEATSLARSGYDVSLIAPAERDETVNGVHIVPVRRSRSRFFRMVNPWRVLRPSLKQKADLYHFHDPELLPVGTLIKLLTRSKSVFDVHENIVGQIQIKAWIPRFLKRPVAMIYTLMELLFLRSFDEIIIAEDSYAEIYRRYKNLTCVRNYPLSDQFPSKAPAAGHLSKLIYVGGLTEPRGIINIIKAFKSVADNRPGLSLCLAGPANPAAFSECVAETIRQYELPDKVKVTGVLPYDEAKRLICDADIGLVILQPTPNYINSLPTKLFEYMSAGIPVIASDFPLWKRIVEDNECGLTVDPQDIEAIGNAMAWLIDNPKEALRMGENGRRAAVLRYDWSVEEERLLELYAKLASGANDVAAPLIKATL